MPQMRSREIREGVASGVGVAVILAVVSAIKGRLAELPLGSSLEWFGAVVAQPVGIPLGVLLFGAAALVPLLLRLGHRAPPTTPAPEVTLSAPVPEIPLPPEEVKLLKVFGTQGVSSIRRDDLWGRSGLTELRLAHALGGLRLRGFVEDHPADRPLSRIPTIYLTAEGRAWLVSNGHA